MGEPFDLSAYIDSLGPMTPEQRAVVDDGMARVAPPDSRDGDAFLRDAALYLTTLVLVGDATAFDDDTWLLIEAMRRKHRGDRD
ncbi:hypothetical protein JN535_00005 [Cellulosimicrobium cellulans]|uniref:hypothetical protein n=1 Tax=Cellulosimicrobium cellulans TaxID=1710 RepID=UPI001965EE1E|nr:hypothetical protein [Cellulosimicrobium cellulans]MBN0038555.1 hypothetical protein [Cellulosimicrobium cellulans]